MVRAFVLGVIAWGVEAFLLVVLAAAVVTAAGPPKLDAGPACPSDADPRLLGGDGTLLAKFHASAALDSTARVNACLELAKTDVRAAATGVARLGTAAAPVLFARLLTAQGDDRKSLDVLLQAALPTAFPPREDDGSEEELPVERWLEVARREGPDLTPHEAALAVDRLVVNPSKGREESVRRLGTVAVPSLVHAMRATRGRLELALLTGLAHEATSRGLVLPQTASAAQVDAAVDDWTEWLDDHRWDFEPHPIDRRIPWELRETRFARLLERTWASWTEPGPASSNDTSSSLAVLVTAERALAAMALGRLLLLLLAELRRTLGLPDVLALPVVLLPGASALALRLGGDAPSLLAVEWIVVSVGASLTAACLLGVTEHEARLRHDPIARLTREVASPLARALLAAAAPLTTVVVVYFETQHHAGGLGASLNPSEWLSPASLPAFNRVALLLPALRFGLRVLRHLAHDERFPSSGGGALGAEAW